MNGAYLLFDMAQSGYSTYYSQSAYAYPAPTPQPPSQSHDARMQPQYQQHYQQQSYVQPSPTHPHQQGPLVQRPLSRVSTSHHPPVQPVSLHHQPSTVNNGSYSSGQPVPMQRPPSTVGAAHHPQAQPTFMQRPPSRIDPVPYSPSQTGPMTSPLPQHYGQYFSSPSPQPYSAQPTVNPYPSPISPQTPQSATPQSIRRPLPSPRVLPPPPSGNNQSFPTPQSSPSPGPFVGSHRPTRSVPNAFPVQSRPEPVPRLPSGQEASPTGSAFSPASTSPPRPLPLPGSSGPTDSSSMHTPVQIQPQMVPKRALPAPVPSAPQDESPRNSEPLSAPGQKFVPMWKRALPQPGGSAIASTSVSAQTQTSIERRSTVSGGTARPLPSPGQPSTAVSVSQAPLSRTGTLPAHLQLQNAPSTSQRDSRSQALGSSFQTPSSTVVPITKGTPQVSRLPPRERSRTLPMPSAAPTGPLPPQPTFRATSTSTQGTFESPLSSDDEELTNALLERHPRPPSPQYGIRDLPHRQGQWVQSNGQNEVSQTRRQLPSPGPPSPQPGAMSLASRMAAAELRSKSPSPTFRPGHSPSHSTSSIPSSRPMPQPPSQTAPQQTGWPTGLPPLPQVPGINGPPASQSAFAQMQARALPLPTRSNTTAATTFPRPRSPRKMDLDLSLDDAPPPSLRRSPAPQSSFPQSTQPRSPAAPPSSFAQSNQVRSPMNSTPPLPSAPAMSARSHTAPGGSTLQRTTSDAASVFSLSNFPAPPTGQPMSPRKNTFGSSSPPKLPFQPASPTKSSFQPTSPQKPSFQPPPQSRSAFQPSSSTRPVFRPPSPTKPVFQPPPPSNSQFSARSQSPVRFQAPPASAPQRQEPVPRTPKISFPASADGDSDEDDMNGGPVINISGPGSSAPPSLPRISFGDDNDGDSGLPTINIGGADDGPSIPQISLPGETRSSPRKNQSQTRKMQETLSNPRLEAAKRSGLVCGGCGGAIIGRIVSAMDMRWHPGCFRCCVCDELLENLSSYAHDGRPYCHLDYHEVRLASISTPSLQSPVPD